MSQNNELPPLSSALLDAINECATSVHLTPTSQTKTISSLKNEIRDYARAALAAQAVQSGPVGCVAKDGLTILYFQPEQLPFETDLYTHPAPVRQPLSDDDIEALGHRMASTYTHRSDPTSHAYGFVRHTLIDFVRAIEAKITGAAHD